MCDSMQMDTVANTIRHNLNALCLQRGWVSQKNPTLGSASKLSEALGRTSSFWSDRLSGRRAMSLKLAYEIEEKLDLPKHSLQEADAPDFVDVPRIDVRLAAGHGSVAEVEEVVGHLKFTRSFLRSCGLTAASAKVVDVKGHSMDPTIKDGAVLLVSTSNREPVDNQIYALVRPSEGLIVKRLRRINDHWVARSDNPDGNSDIIIDDGEPIQIIGRAIWMGARL